MLYSGIDLHKHSLVIHTVAEDGTRVRAAELATARPALSAYFATLPGPHRAWWSVWAVGAESAISWSPRGLIKQVQYHVPRSRVQLRRLLVSCSVR